MKKILALITLITVVLTCNAQLPQEFGRFKRAAKVQPTESVENMLVTKIAKDGAFVLSQSYQLEDSVGKFFGLSGNKEFGTETTLALKVKNGYLLYDIARVPWDYNPRFAKLKKRYNPVLFPSQYSDLNREARYDSIYFNSNELVTIYPEQIYGMKSDTFFNDGFSVSHHVGETDGYVIWYVLPHEIDINASSDLDIIPIEQKIEIVEDRSREYTIPLPQANGTLMGGMYVVPEISGVGRLDFKINGIIIGAEDEWKLVCPFTENDNIFLTEPVTVQTDEDIEVELTPNDSKKK